METLVLTPHESSFTGEAGDEVVGGGFWLPEREPPEGFYRVKVAGVSHRRDELQRPEFDPGRDLALVPEPDNPHDPNAVGIWDAAREHQVGFVPREQARLIGRRLRAGRLTRTISLWEWRQGHDGERISLEVLVCPEAEVSIAEG